MASISNDPNGRKRIQFTDDDGKRHAIRLGKVSQANAAIAQRNIETLSLAKIGNQPLPKTTTEWLNAIPRKLRERLEKIGLIAVEERVTLWRFLDEKITPRDDIKATSRIVYGNAVRNLKEFFAADKLITSVSEGDATDFSRWLACQPLAAETRKKRLSSVRSFFETARRHRLIDRNPFEGMRLPGSDVRARQSFVDRETVYRLMESSPPSYRLMIALCRFQGLRAPSEVCSLKWDMVHFERNEITIPSPKTEHHPGGSRRIMPLCPDMRAILLDTLNREGEGDGFVVGREFYDRAKTSRRYGWQAINLNTHLRRLIEKAGLEPWPRAWHNLRSSLETELMRHFPVPQVAAWLGHNPQIALRHYNQTSGEANRLAYDRLSAGIHLEEAEKSDSKSGASYPSTIPQLTQKASHHLSAANNTESQTVSVRDDGIVTYAESCDELPNGTGVHSVHKLDATGLKLSSISGKTLRFTIKTTQKASHMTQKVSRLRESSAKRQKELAEVNPEIAEIIRAWPMLSPSIRAAALAVIRSESRECRNIIQRKA